MSSVAREPSASRADHIFPSRQHSIIVVPARVSQSLGCIDAYTNQRACEENCSLVDGGLVKFVAGDGSRDIWCVCGTIAATYAGALGLFDGLSGRDRGDGRPEQPVVVRVRSHADSRSALPVSARQAMTEALMKQCLILAAPATSDSMPRQTRPSLPRCRTVGLARAITAIVERPAAPHTVDSLAALAGMSRSTFADRFAAMFGQTPIDFVQRVRLRLGAHLLGSTDLPSRSSRPASATPAEATSRGPSGRPTERTRAPIARSAAPKKRSLSPSAGPPKTPRVIRDV